MTFMSSLISKLAARLPVTFLDRAVPASPIPQEVLTDATARLQSAWQRIWERVFARAETLVWKAGEEGDEDDQAQPATPLAWAKRETKRAEKDYTAEWIAVAILCYLAAIGLEPRDAERRLVERAAVETARETLRPLHEQIERAVAEISAAILARPNALTAQADAAVQALHRVATFHDPTPTAAAGLTSFVDDALAQVARTTTPAKAFAELHTSMDFQIRRIVGQVNAGSISQQEWRAGMKAIFADNYREAFRLGKLQNGGEYVLTAADQARLQSLITDENKFLTRWLRDARTKYLKMPEEARAARMMWRGRLYADALKGVYNEGWLSVVPGGEEVLWTRTALESCATCIAEAALGWRPAATLTRVPGDGSTICTTHCQCYLARRTAPNQQANSQVLPRDDGDEPQEPAAT